MEILLVLQIIIVVAMIAVILVQKTSGDGFTGGGASPNSFLTGRATANLFSRTTAILGTAFIVNSLVLAYMASHSERASSVLDKAVEEVETNKKKNPTVPTSDKFDPQTPLNPADLKKNEEKVVPTATTEPVPSNPVTNTPVTETPATDTTNQEPVKDEPAKEAAPKASVPTAE